MVAIWAGEREFHMVRNQFKTNFTSHRRFTKIWVCAGGWNRPCMCMNSPQWKSPSGPGWVCWLWMECGPCYGPEPWYIPERWAQAGWNKLSFDFQCDPDPLKHRLLLQTFSASRLLLISAPSRRVWRSALEVSAPLSFPARSIRENLPCIFSFLRRMIWNTAWLRDECALADVCPDVLEAQERKGEQHGSNECRVCVSI